MSCALLATGWQISNSFCLFCKSALQQLCSLQSHTSVAIGTYVPTHILWRPTDLWRQEDTMTAPYFFPGFLALPQIRFLLKLTFSCSQSTSPFLCENLGMFHEKIFPSFVSVNVSLSDCLLVCFRLCVVYILYVWICFSVLYFENICKLHWVYCTVEKCAT